MLICLPKVCHSLSGRVVRLNCSLYEPKQTTRSWHGYLFSRMKRLDFEHCPVDACVSRLVEEGSVTISAVVHVDDMFAVGRKERRYRVCENSNRSVSTNSLEELPWYAGCHFTQDRETDY